MPPGISELLAAALHREPAPDRLLLHAFLGRLCDPRAGILKDMHEEPPLGEEAAALEQRMHRDLHGQGWVSAFLREVMALPPGAERRRLVLCGAALQALDAYHRDRRTEVAGDTVEIPPDLGGGRVAFLPSPAAPIAERVPPAKRLPRETGDLRNDLRSVLGLWWHLVDLDRFAVEPRFRRLEIQLSAELEQRLSVSGDLRVALVSPFAALDFEVQGDPTRCGVRGTPYRFVRIAPASLDAARAALEAVVDACAEHRVDVLCFPELTLDTTLRAHLQDLLAARNAGLHPVLVVAGSFHIDGDEGWINRCRMLDGSGNVLFSQDKCVDYGIPAAQAAEMGAELRARLGIDERGGYEDIARSRTLTIVDSPLGRLATPICLDFCGDELRELLIACGVNLYFVPAMTRSMEDFRVRARELGTRSRATTFVVNSAWLLQQLGRHSPEHLIHAYVPSTDRPPNPAREICEAGILFSIRELLGLR